jgi:uncharacterized protein YceH (UPF0502 family)
MDELTADECRVLGVLVEKAFTTPDQYPLTLNAVVNGCNQKNNRDPITSIDETRAFDALESLRAKKLVIRADMAGSRVNKYKHTANDVLHVRAGELAVLAELLLRGPQTLGEIRGRASRMHPLESLEVVKNLLEALMQREQPLAKQIPPAPGSRAERYVQLLSPALYPEDPVASPLASNDEPSQAQSSLQERLMALEAEVAALRSALSKLAIAVGEPDPFNPAS